MSLGLCRHSSNKPFRVGSHATIDFTERWRTEALSE
jgi:CDGSH-type Zn-finger protein